MLSLDEALQKRHVHVVTNGGVRRWQRIERYCQWCRVSTEGTADVWYMSVDDYGKGWWCENVDSP